MLCLSSFAVRVQGVLFVDASMNEVKFSGRNFPQSRRRFLTRSLLNGPCPLVETGAGPGRIGTDVIIDIVTSYRVVAIISLGQWPFIM